MISPKVSVIIPTHNRAYIIERAIKSVKSQSYENIELIVVDDGSDDQTQEILSQYELINLKQKNLGVSAARNAGIEICSGELICFLDSDDEWLDNKLEEQVQFLQQNPEYKWVHSDEIWIRNGKRVNQMKKHQKGGGDQFLPSLSLCLVSPSTVMLDRSLLDIHKFDEEYTVCEDYDLWLRLLIEHSIGYIDKPLIKKYGGHDDQLSRRFFAMDYWRVRTLARLLDRLDGERLQKSCEVGLQKCQVLINGYKKHNNLENLEFIISQERLFQEHLQRLP